MASLYEKFKSNQNKGLIWKLLIDDGIFTNIPDSSASLIQKEFERKIEVISGKISTTDTLTNLDKQVIEEMIAIINSYKNRNLKKEEINYNAEDLSQKRQKAFQNELTNKQKEFDTFKTPVPDKIDFSDNLDSPIGSEMDKILAEQIALREKQLNMVLQTQNKEIATKWIQNPGEVSIQNPSELKEPIKLKIGEKIKEETKPKKVNFADTDDTFFDLLKKKDSPDIETLLREILTKQNQILELLQKNNT
jgi:hypothetical protein